MELIGGALLVLTVDEESGQSFTVSPNWHLCWQRVVLCIWVLFTKFLGAVNWKTFKSIIFKD